MARIKDQIYEQELQEEAAGAICVRAGILKKCEVCGELMSYDFDTEAAYKLGNALITAGDPLVDVFHKDRRLMTDTVKEVFEGTSNNVCSCQASYEGRKYD